LVTGGNANDLSFALDWSAIQAQVGDAVRVPRKGGDAVALLRVGIDGLPEVSATWGREAADAVRASLARRISRVLNSGEILGRAGADEFAIVARSLRADQALPLAYRVLTRISHTPVEIVQARDHLFFTASIGVAVYPAPGLKGADDLIRAAERARTIAQQSGGNRVVASTDSIPI